MFSVSRSMSFYFACKAPPISIESFHLLNLFNTYIIIIINYEDILAYNFVNEIMSCAIITILLASISIVENNSWALSDTCWGSKQFVTQIPVISKSEILSLIITNYHILSSHIIIIYYHLLSYISIFKINLPLLYKVRNSSTRGWNKRLKSLGSQGPG